MLQQQVSPKLAQGCSPPSTLLPLPGWMRPSDPAISTALPRTDSSGRGRRGCRLHVGGHRGIAADLGWE